MTDELSLTAAIITYNSADYIEECLTSLKDAGLSEKSLLVVDDGSTDSTVDIVGRRFQQVKIVSLGGNFGHSRACNEALHAADTEWVVLIDHDTVAHPDWLNELESAIGRHPEAGILVSRAVFASDCLTIHSDGGYPHYLGNMILRNGFTEMSEADNEEVELGAAGTTSMAVNRHRAKSIGLFDEDFFIYLNDFEFSLRMRLAGYQIFCAPQSLIYHKGGSQGVSFRGQGAYPPMRAYLIFRNRWSLLLKIYSLKTLLLCSPPLAVFEILLFLMAIKKGVLKEYLRAFSWVVRNFSLVLGKRRDVQSLRLISDRELLFAGELTFVPGLVDSPLVRSAKRVLDCFFNLYWIGVSALL